MLPSLHLLPPQCLPVQSLFCNITYHPSYSSRFQVLSILDLLALLLYFCNPPAQTGSETTGINSNSYVKEGLQFNSLFKSKACFILYRPFRAFYIDFNLKEESFCSFCGQPVPALNHSYCESLFPLCLIGISFAATCVRGLLSFVQM